jgi:23S rRNA (cytosine1962-C5)-methyltransferase
VLADDALLVSCSCSWHLPPGALPELLQAAARHESRLLQVLEFRGQAADHPVHPAVPESRYLKAVFARLTRSEPR